MPAFVKHERAWQHAKNIVKKQYPDKKGADSWRLVTAIYKRLAPKDIKKTANQLLPLTAAVGLLNKRADWLSDVRAKQQQRITELDGQRISEDSDNLTQDQMSSVSSQTSEPNPVAAKAVNETNVAPVAAQPVLDYADYRKFTSGGDSNTYNYGQYKYNQNNIAVSRNINKNRKDLDSILNTDNIDPDQYINLLMDDPTYSAQVRAHYDALPADVKNRIFVEKDRPTGTIKYTRTNNPDITAEVALYNNGDAHIYANPAYYTNRFLNTDIGETLAVFPMREQQYVHLTGGSQGEHIAAQHEINHARLYRAGTAVNNIQAVSDKGYGTYTGNRLEQQQAAANNAQAVYAQQRLIAAHPELFKHMDQNKLKEFMSLKPFAKTPQEFEQRLDFLARNPEFSLLLGGEGNRVVSMYIDHQNAMQGFSPTGEYLMDEPLWEKDDTIDKDKAKQEYDTFIQDSYPLAYNSNNVNTYHG